jgi:hypothetical protein
VAESDCVVDMGLLREYVFYERGDEIGTSISEASFRNFCLISTFCGATKKGWLLGEYYKYFKMFVNLQGDVSK